MKQNKISRYRRLIVAKRLRGSSPQLSLATLAFNIGKPNLKLDLESGWKDKCWGCNFS